MSLNTEQIDFNEEDCHIGEGVYVESEVDLTYEELKAIATMAKDLYAYKKENQKDTKKASQEKDRLEYEKSCWDKILLNIEETEKNLEDLKRRGKVLKAAKPELYKKGSTPRKDKNGKPIDRSFNYCNPEKAKTNLFCKYSNGKDGLPPPTEHLGCKLIYKNKSGREKHYLKGCTHKDKYGK